jgi:hypothetical protein
MKKKKKKSIAAGWGIFLAVLSLGHFLTGTIFVLHLNIESIANVQFNWDMT